MASWKTNLALAAWAHALALAGCGSGAHSSGTFSISGSIVGNSTATVNLAGAASASTTTDGADHFTFGSLRNGTYILTPSLAGYTFYPPTTTVTIDGTDVAGESFELCSLDAWCVNLVGPWFLMGVWDSSASDVWAVAENGGILGAAATLHFDGHAWSSVDLGQQPCSSGCGGAGRATSGRSAGARRPPTRAVPSCTSTVRPGRMS